MKVIGSLMISLFVILSGVSCMAMFTPGIGSATGDTAFSVPSNPDQISVEGGFLANPTHLSTAVITSNYGWRLHPVHGDHRLHAGIDFRTGCNNNIYAAADGLVVSTQTKSGLGNQVMIDHGITDGRRLHTSYNHLSSFVVAAGAHVQTGDLIALSGTTGTSTACHLHLEVLLDGKPVDPTPYLTSVNP